MSNHKISTEEKAVIALASECRGNLDLMFDFDSFKPRYQGAILSFLYIEGRISGEIIAEEDAFNEYEHIVMQEPNSEYLNVFNHKSKL